MDSSFHSMNTLFSQLGLASADTDILAFIEQHSLSHSSRLDNAEFWSPPQRDFLSQALAEDADWAEVVDELDALLHRRHKPAPGKPWLSKACLAALPQLCAY